jgi:hypothetical protein
MTCAGRETKNALHDEGQAHAEARGYLSILNDENVTPSASAWAWMSNQD